MARRSAAASGQFRTGHASSRHWVCAQGIAQVADFLGIRARWGAAN